MKPCSLPKATTDPVRLTPPMTAPSRVAITGMAGNRLPEAAWPAESRNSETATTAAAPPPAPLKMATICGMAVIGTRRAPSTPATVPTRPAPATIHQCSSMPGVRATVQITTSAIPAAPSWLPVRAVFGEARNLSARMKVTDATR